jgi:phytoene synthase
VNNSSFYWAMRLMPRRRRVDMFALYRFCHMVDDIADGPGSREERLAKLAVIRATVAAYFETGTCLSPSLAPLATAITRNNLPRGEIDALLDGMECDVNTPLTQPSLSELLAYCRQVAGTVGVMAVNILGRPDARRFAVLTADALQLTNILRDLEEDAERGRLYLPREALEEAGLSCDTGPRSALTHPRFAHAWNVTADLAAARFHEAEAELARIGRKGLWPALAMSATYRELLKRLMRQGWRPGQPSIRLSGPTKARIALQALLAGA